MQLMAAIMLTTMHLCRGTAAPVNLSVSQTEALCLRTCEKSTGAPLAQLGCAVGGAPPVAAAAAAAGGAPGAASAGRSRSGGGTAARPGVCPAIAAPSAYGRQQRAVKL